MAENNYSSIGGSLCFEDGFSYHIHEKWDYNDSNDTIGSTACGSTYTGGHWDPWLACGPATGNTYCVSQGGCVNGSSVLGNQGYNCNNNTFGDWSGKYGTTYGSGNSYAAVGYSPYEVNGGDLLNFSVVFHCVVMVLVHFGHHLKIIQQVAFCQD